MAPRIYIGCAGWSIPRPYAGSFPLQGTHLERYARTFSAVEINSSFYRHHRPETYRRWAHVVPHDFRFSVKMPRTVTHDRALANSSEILERFFAEIAELETKLGPVLVQLPPCGAYDAATADKFFTRVRELFFGDVVIEPRHPSWFSAEALQHIVAYKIARVATDPACVSAASQPAGAATVAYFRLHGSPQIYYSPYDKDALDSRAEDMMRVLRSGINAWCIFDNTTVGYATDNALYLQESLRHSHLFQPVSC